VDGHDTFKPLAEILDLVSTCEAARQVAGVRAWIVKPFKPDAMLEAFRKLAVSKYAPIFFRNIAGGYVP
jgi:hypothetical protein